MLRFQDATFWAATLEKEGQSQIEQQEQDRRNELKPGTS
jgi:hypothetical protein